MSSESSTAGRRLPVCRRCRQNHLRCDKKKPVCSACEKAKQPARCFYDPKPLRFSHSTYSAASDRLGNDTHRDVEIDHESDVVSDIVHGGQQSPLVHVGDPFQFAGLPDSLDQFRQQNLPVLPVTTGSEGTVPDIPLITSPSDGLALERSAVGAHGSHDATWFLPIHGSPVQNHALHSLPLGPSPMLSSPAGVTAIQSLSPTSREPTTILKEKLECKVFGFYITYMGKWLDVGSPKHYFQARVPQLAVQEPLVLYACLACAAQIMFLIGILDQSVEERYSEKVLEILIPLLSSDQANSTNEVLLATTVVLRMAEQFLELGQDSQRHLNGAASLFMDGTNWPLSEDNLAVASFWTHLRESIRICFLREQPPQFDLNQLTVTEDYTETSVPEEVWTNRMTYLLLSVCELCWGSRKPSRAIANQLHVSLDRWKGHLPYSYRPWCVRDDGDQAFPEIKYFESWHVMAWQFYYTAKVMLAVCFPGEAESSNVYYMKAHIDSQVVSPTRLLCGLCMSSNHVGANLNGSHLMAWCGQFLSSRDEQKRLFDYLTELGERTKWPNQTSINRLREQWKSSNKSWGEC